MQVTLTYDGAATYVDGERATLLIGTDKGAVLMILSSGKRLAVSAADYERAQQQGQATAETIPRAVALRGAAATWSVDEREVQRAAAS